MSAFATITSIRGAPTSPSGAGIASLAWAASTIELVAAILVLGALIALLAAVVAATRQPGGLAALLRGGAHRETDPSAAAEAEQTAEDLRALIEVARDMSDQLATTFDARVAELERRLADLEAREASLRLTQTENAPHSTFRAEPKLGSPLPSGFSRSPGPALPQPNHDADPMTGEIYRLSDRGLPAVEIARHLGQHTGKVELILALRRA